MPNFPLLFFECVRVFASFPDSMAFVNINEALRHVVSSRFGYDVDVTSRYTLIALGVVSQLTSFPAGLISEL